MISLKIVLIKVIQRIKTIKKLKLAVKTKQLYELVLRRAIFADQNIYPGDPDSISMFPSVKLVPANWQRKL